MDAETCDLWKLILNVVIKLCWTVKVNIHTEHSSSVQHSGMSQVKLFFIVLRMSRKFHAMLLDVSSAQSTGVTQLWTFKVKEKYRALRYRYISSIVL
jgi:hypothetical protein